VSLGNTSGGRDDGRVGPVVERGKADPCDHQGRWEKPASQVTATVESCFGGEFPKGGQIHCFIILILRQFLIYLEMEKEPNKENKDEEETKGNEQGVEYLDDELIEALD